MIDLVLPLGNRGRSTSQLTLTKRAKCSAFDFHSLAHKAVEVQSMRNNGLCAGPNLGVNSMSQEACSSCFS